MLKRVSIQNFKSLKAVTLDLQKVNLLIGPNNSGKSNFLKALNYVAKQNANSSEMNFLDLVYDKDADNCIDILLICSIEESLYEFKCFVSAKDEVRKTLRIESKHEIVAVSADSYNYRVLLDILGPLIFYRIDPNMLIQPGPVGLKQGVLAYNVSDIVNYLDLVVSKYRKSVLLKIERDIERCISEFNEIKLDNVFASEKLVRLHDNSKAFKRIGLAASNQNKTYWADELSEGTLYFLALLCIINQPNPPKLLLLEEPEKGIHPRRIWEVMRFVFQLAEEKDIQIILTTHNEHVVNAFASMPEAVFVFEKNEEGATEVKNLKRDIIDVSNKKSEENGFDPIDFTSDLGKSWLYGLIGGVPDENI